MYDGAVFDCCDCLQMTQYFMHLYYHCEAESVSEVFKTFLFIIPV